MIKVSIADTENVSVEGILRIGAMVVWPRREWRAGYSRRRRHHIRKKGHCDKCDHGRHLSKPDVGRYWLKLISKVRRYANVLVETLEAW